jgi:SAM-dependent methyltransferase
MSVKENQVRDLVKERYGRFAEQASSCCGPSTCCGPSGADLTALQLGYSREDLQKAPEGSNLGLGCGNPIAAARLQPGEVVLDLGSGAGFDAFLAAAEVGPEGRVIGVDMTPAMLERARANARKAGVSNVEFRQGYIESLPLGDASVDVLLSNCVINLSPDKPAVFREAFRVLKGGGRLVVSDIVLRGQLPEHVLQSAAAYVGCVAGAWQAEDYLEAIRKAGFEALELLEDGGMELDGFEADPVAQQLIGTLGRETVQQAVQAVRHVIVEARKP